MVSSLVLAFLTLVAQTYDLGTTLGRPDTVKILVSPQRVAEHGDRIVVLDEERPGILAVKRYSLDGFFEDALPYEQDRDDPLFTGSSRLPDAELTDRLEVSGETFRRWETMATAPDGTIWLVYSHQAGDAGGLGLLALDPESGSVRARGFGPGTSAYSVTSVRRRRFVRQFDWPVYLHVGIRYAYLIAHEMLWQYDRQARLVRRVGIESEGAFKEPYGITTAENRSLFITDFRLGLVWEYNPTQRGRMAKTAASGCIEPESPTCISTAGRNTLVLSDIAGPSVRTIRSGRQVCAFAPRRVGPIAGGTDFRTATRGNMLLLHEYPRDRILVYDTLGAFIRSIDSDPHGGSRIVGIDNEGYCYGLQSGRHFRFLADRTDTFWLTLPDTAMVYDFDWTRNWRVADTLYVLGSRPRPGSVPARCLFVLVGDRLESVLAETWFEGGLYGYISDFCVDPAGSIWFVDIGNRVVREYRPTR